MHTCREDVPRLPAPVLRMMLDSMLCQDYRGDFELIVVDLLWHERHEQFRQMVAESGAWFPVLHIPDKPGPFKDRKLLRISTPKNTGLMFARGTHVVFADDCQELPEKTLSLCAEWAALGHAATFSYERKFRQDPQDAFYSRGVDERMSRLETPLGASRVVSMHDISYVGASVSMIPMSVLEAVNGWDEMFDGSRQLEDSDLVARIFWSKLTDIAYDARIQIVEYECGGGSAGYGDVVQVHRHIKCNPAYGQYVWGLGRVRANELSDPQLGEAIHRMQWRNCLRLHEDGRLCVPHMSQCYRYDDSSGPDLINEIYRDPRLRFDLAAQRRECNWDGALEKLGVFEQLRP